MKFASSPDFKDREVIGLTPQKGTVFPSAPQEGEQFYYLTDHNYYFYNGTVWTKMGGGGAGSYYLVPSTDTISIPENQVLNALATLRIDGSITLDGMIADDVVVVVA